MGAKTWNMPELEWHYKWFEPSDDSAIWMAEIEVMITRDKLIHRVARTSWDKYEMEEINTSDFEKMSNDELKWEFQEWTDWYKSTIWYKMWGIKLLFIDKVNLVLRWREMHDILWQTILYTKSQFWELEEGKKNIKRDYWEKVPLLEQTCEI